MVFNEDFNFVALIWQNDLYSTMVIAWLLQMRKSTEEFKIYHVLACLFYLEYTEKYYNVFNLVCRIHFF